VKTNPHKIAIADNNKIPITSLNVKGKKILTGFSSIRFDLSKTLFMIYLPGIAEITAPANVVAPSIKRSSDIVASLNPITVLLRTDTILTPTQISLPANRN